MNTVCCNATKLFKVIKLCEVTFLRGPTRPADHRERGTSVDISVTPQYLYRLTEKERDQVEVYDVITYRLQRCLTVPFTALSDLLSLI